MARAAMKRERSDPITGAQPIARNRGGVAASHEPARGIETRRKLLALELAIVFGGILLLTFVARRTIAPPSRSPALLSTPQPTWSRVSTAEPARVSTRWASALAPVPASAPAIWNATKAERVSRIVRDYDELTLMALRGFGAPREGSAPASLALLRQLALIDQEKRRDLAAVLTVRELEDLELQETAAGRLVNQVLGGTSATEDQRRAVFRLQHEFELQFGGSTIATPPSDFEREAARQRTQAQIRTVLGDHLFSSWLTTAQ